MKTLTRIRLINWHYLTDCTLDVEGSLYLFGKNESGKSSILDVIQCALVADLRRVRFNASAQEEGRSGRDLLGYVLCKVGEEYRRAEATAYVALQFADADGRPFVVGVVVDAHNDGREEHGFFMAAEQALDDRLFLLSLGRPGLWRLRHPGLPAPSSAEGHSPAPDGPADPGATPRCRARAHPCRPAQPAAPARR